tara:strand:+ start:229 stop:447 length:219 start_codon:yes stop_codon:yes gene_type:complete
MSDDIEARAQERRKQEEKECEKKCHLCICYALLCFACFILVQAIVACVVFMYYRDENRDFYKNKPRLNVTEG